MKTSSIVAKAALGSILSLSGVALGQATIKIDGSSTVYPISSAAAEEFRSVMPKVNVTVGESGTGGGFKRFVKGETDISDASRPITAKEMGECKTNGIEFIELPIAFDALTVVMLVVVNSVSALVHLYSWGYMAHDENWTDDGPALRMSPWLKPLNKVPFLSSFSRPD